MVKKLGSSHSVEVDLRVFYTVKISNRPRDPQSVIRSKFGLFFYHSGTKKLIVIDRKPRARNRVTQAGVVSSPLTQYCQSAEYKMFLVLDCLWDQMWGISFRIGSRKLMAIDVSRAIVPVHRMQRKQKYNNLAGDRSCECKRKSWLKRSPEANWNRLTRPGTDNAKTVVGQIGSPSGDSSNPTCLDSFQDQVKSPKKVHLIYPALLTLSTIPFDLWALWAPVRGTITELVSSPRDVILTKFQWDKGKTSKKYP